MIVINHELKHINLNVANIQESNEISIPTGTLTINKPVVSVFLFLTTWHAIYSVI